MSFTMRVGKKRFCAKTIDRIVENFCRWRDSTVIGSRPVGTHWSVRTRGKVCGDITYDGTYCPKDSPDRPPWIIVEELLAKRSLSRASGKSQEYKAGLRAALEWQYMRSPMECPHAQGSAHADAYIAGVEEVLGPLDSAGWEKLGGGIKPNEAVRLGGQQKEADRTAKE